MANFPVTDLTAKTLFPGAIVQEDDTGLPSMMVYIPAFKNSDVLASGDDSTHPAFIVNGKEIPGFYYSQYQNVVHDGVAYSLPGEDPKTSINFNSALACSEAKGYGWHMGTAAEWAAIALWCRKNGFKPYGNNNYGKDSRESEYKAIPTAYGADGAITRVATGTGPLSWSHDNSPGGIWDLNGNGYEWQGGIRLVWGELQILANNDAADPDNPQNSTSTCWKAINAADGSLVEPESKTTDTEVKASGNTVKLDYEDYTWIYSTGIASASSTSRNCAFVNVKCTDAIGDGAKELLRALALLPDEGANADEYDGDYVAWNNGAAERQVLRGWSWISGTRAGIFAIEGGYSGNSSYENLCFRCAYIPDIEQ